MAMVVAVVVVDVLMYVCILTNEESLQYTIHYFMFYVLIIVHNDGMFLVNLFGVELIHIKGVVYQL